MYETTNELKWITWKPLYIFLQMYKNKRLVYYNFSNICFFYRTFVHFSGMYRPHLWPLHKLLTQNSSNARQGVPKMCWTNLSVILHSRTWEICLALVQAPILRNNVEVCQSIWPFNWQGNNLAEIHASSAKIYSVEWTTWCARTDETRVNIRCG